MTGIFSARARIYSLPDAAIFGLEQRLDHATFWKRKFERINNRISQEGPDILGRRTSFGSDC
ncbi:MAG TPA: hypothetical protein VFW75_04610 [Acetobacteraceae bacterium]|nr:hypothetical protein [Acetobacteraceae bacterium]